jgi:Flp pilus assembly protein TadD
LDDRFASIVQQNKNNIDRQIDYMEYFLGFRGKANANLEYPINLAASTPAQRDRYFKITEDFCGKNVVSDFSLIPDRALKERCYAIQSGLVAQRLNETTDAGKRAALYAHMGDISLQNGNISQAIASFQEAVSLNPHDKTTFNNLGIAYMQAQRYTEAIASLSEAIRIDPNYSRAHENYGIALASQGGNHIEEAMSHYREALRIDPEDADAYNNLGSALMDLRKFDDAAANFIRALELNPTHPKAQINMQKIMALRQSGAVQ